MADANNPVTVKDEVIREENNTEIARLLEAAGAVPQDPDTIATILASFHDPDHFKSLTNVTREERDSFLRLEGMNLIAKNPLITNYCKSFLDINRSQSEKPVSLLEGLFNIATGWIPRRQQ